MVSMMQQNYLLTTYHPITLICLLNGGLCTYLGVGGGEGEGEREKTAGEGRERRLPGLESGVRVRVDRNS